MLNVKKRKHRVRFFESLVWLNLRLNPGLPHHSRVCVLIYVIEQFFESLVWFHLELNPSFPVHWGARARVSVSMCVCGHPIPYATSRMWHKANFMQSTTDLNSEFSFSYAGCLTKSTERAYRVRLFPRSFIRSETPTASAGIWKKGHQFDFYGDNHHAKGTSIRNLSTMSKIRHTF